MIEYTAYADGTVKLSDALSIAINDMVSNNYHESYENGEFVRFWDNTLLPAYEEKYKELQNKFYWKAYGYNAYRLLVQMMGAYHDNLDDDEKKVLKGMVFSIMEARYRNKNVQGKMNLEVKASEGELWPFLVNLENLKSIAYDKNNDRYIDTSKNETYYKWPEFEKIVEGAYQWMLYYDADTIRTTSHRTITKVTSTNEDSDNEVEVDWEGEFCELTWQYLPALSGKELENFYSNCQLVKSIFKKSKENTEGIFGAEELYDITSDKNFSEAIKDMKEAIIEFCDNKTIDSVWTGLTDYNIERTYIMAKNIVETNKVNDEFAYYNIGTNILTYTYGRHGKEYLLMDFQRVALEEPLKDKYDVWTNKDTDRDGILDRNELGDDSSSDESSMWAKVDITSFIKKMVEKELYGTDTNSINSEEGKLVVDNALAQVKYNVYKERQDFLTEHEDDNICDRREDKENYLNIDTVTEGRVNGKTDNEIKAIMKENSAKLQVRLWKYKSNPVLKDTDFDGLDDNIDKVPKDNRFTGRMNSTRLSGMEGLEVDMNMDYRYFFMSNKLYFDELSTMSLLYANSVYMQNSGISVYNENNPSHSNLRIKELMEFYGFSDVKTYYMGSATDDGYEVGDICRNYHKNDTHKGRVAIGYRNVEYHGLIKTVIGIVIRGTAEDDDWDSDFDMGDINLKRALDTKTVVSSGKENNTVEELTIDGSTRNSRIIDSYFANNSVLTYGSENKPLDYKKEYFNELKHFAYGYPDWKWDYHHAGFDIVSNRIIEVLNDYITMHGSKFKGKRCFWVTGHSMGAGVANLVSASLIYGECGGNADNVYCYTFAAPNTFYRTDNQYSYESRAIPGKNVTGDYREPKGVKYRCIFNIVNEDDFVPEVPMKDCNWTKYGRTASISFNANIPIKKIQPRMDETLTNTERFIYVEYKGNREIIKDIVDSFNLMFEDNPDNMRYDAYRFNDDNCVQISKAPSAEWIIPDNTKPYQKIFTTNWYNLDYQMPAYFMQYLAFSMGTNIDLLTIDISGFGFMKAKFYYKYALAKDKLINNRNSIKSPHFLETYYLLTKRICTLDFK